MTKRNRDTLKKRFGEGEMPSANDFEDLIESVLNIHDDGIAHTERDGLRLTQISGANRVLSLYGAVEEQTAVWALGLDQHRESLTLDVSRRSGGRDDGRIDPDDDGGGYAVLTLYAPDGPELGARVGINTETPRCELDVDGYVASAGRLGEQGKHEALADAEWHPIAGPFQGCTALEIVAGAGKRDSGKYALMHAFALRTFDAKGEFTYHQAHYGSRRHRMQLRWVDDSQIPGNYTLEIRVNCAYGPDTWIQYHVTSLWQDAMMSGCAMPPKGARP